MQCGLDDLFLEWSEIFGLLMWLVYNRTVCSEEK